MEPGRGPGGAAAAAAGAGKAFWSSSPGLVKSTFSTCIQRREIKGGRENQISYLKISKLALAFAIIHSKPPGKSAREYTEYLARTVPEQDFGWKWKAEVLEAEVLRLRQELLLNRISPRFCLENRKQDASAETVLGQESINPTSYSSQLEDSGCDFQALDSVSQTLSLLGRNNILRNSLISLLLSEVRQFAEQLLQAHQVQSVYDIDQYENISFLCMILEQLLQNETEESNVSSSDYGGEEKIKFLKNLDQIILHLSDEFPLFSLYLWRVSVLLNSGQMQID
ncbi:meiosis-specific protein MEI4 isoform X3 [Prinia subflava]|uniref:meiosis-specific protein MEI4 isoform X3 n=1 Tax=Prinia subflava TaxID=208062 RepID=UPI002FE2B96D